MFDFRLGASQLGDNHTPLVGPGLQPGTTVSSYLEDAYAYTYSFCWWALLINMSYTLAFTSGAILLMKKVSFLKR
jgi:hypothetical protein